MIAIPPSLVCLYQKVLFLNAEREEGEEDYDDEEEEEEEERGGSFLLGGEYDEEESSHSFQEALREWRGRRREGGERRQGGEAVWRPAKAQPGNTHTHTHSQTFLFLLLPSSPIFSYCFGTTDTYILKNIVIQHNLFCSLHLSLPVSQFQSRLCHLAVLISGFCCRIMCISLWSTESMHTHTHTYTHMHTHTHTDSTG